MHRLSQRVRKPKPQRRIWDCNAVSSSRNAVFVLMMKSPEDDELFGGLLNDMGEPDSEGLPTHVDENGMLWRNTTMVKLIGGTALQ